MNALAHYLLLSASLGYGEDEQREEAKKLLARLETIDADRKERYRELRELPSLLSIANPSEPVRVARRAHDY